MITQKELKQEIQYETDTGLFYWLINKPGRQMNIKVGCIDKDKNYLIITIDGISYGAHRLAWLYYYGQFPNGQIDHKNQNRQDNRIDNLRDVSPSTNMKNKSKYRNNNSGVVGVRFCKKAKVWIAQIGVDKKVIYLGSFKDKAEAISVRKDAEIAFGFHPNHGLFKEW